MDDDTLTAGAGREEIRYPEGVWPYDGFDRQRDALCARVVVLRRRRTVVLAVLDQTSLPDMIVAAMRESLVRFTGALPSDVVIAVSHTFSAPHLSAPGLRSDVPRERASAARTAVLAAVERAAAAAVSTMRAARVGAGAGSCAVGVNRDLPTRDGYVLGVNESGFRDPHVGVLRIDDLAGIPIAFLANVAVQPSILNEAGPQPRAVTADLAGSAAAHVEAAWPGSVALFLLGAAGDQAPAVSAVQVHLDAHGGTVRHDSGEAGFALVDALGTRLGAELVRVARVIEAVDAVPVLEVAEGTCRVTGQVPLPRHRFAPTNSYSYTRAGQRDLPYWLVRVGEALIVGVQVELSARTGCEVRHISPFAHTMVATLVNGAAKYLPEADAFDRFTYAALTSRYARGGAEVLTGTLERAMAGLRDA